MISHRARLVLVAGACLAVLGCAGGCGSNREDDVHAVAARFYAAVADHRGPDACALLAPPTRSGVEQTEQRPCPAAVMSAGLKPTGAFRSAHVYGAMAQVRWASEVTFLTRYDDGWRVLAAGCTMPPPSQRTADHYDCTVQGG